MSRIPPVAPPPDTSSSSYEALRGLDMGDFMKLMIVEMQNQDPLDPMDNSDILQQMSQMRAISATDRLSETLDAVLTGQNLTTASSLIGKEISALADDGTEVHGVVDRVSIDTGSDDNATRTLKVHIGDQAVLLNNVREIVEPTPDE